MMSELQRPPLAAEARRLTRQGEWQAAAEKLKQLISEVTGRKALSLTINRDQYSLNSLNGRVTLENQQTFFFKYHHEEGEESTVEEYYRAELLREHGFAVDVPLFTCGEPGRQILLYSLRNDRRLADVCRDIETRHDWQAIAPIVIAQREADEHLLRQTLPTLRQATAEEIAGEAIHQLFYHRLISDGVTPGLGGRVATFYIDKTFLLGDQQIEWQHLKDMQWCINGVLYPHTLESLFLESGRRLNPDYLNGQGVVVAHGDAHNANIWYEEGEPPRLVSFDPAFAGSAIPSLLAEIKATFHNIFAHPCWLYEPQDAAKRYSVTVSVQNNQINVTHNWQLTPLREAFLVSKGDLYWKPLLAALKAKGWLPEDWQRIIRLALFCCPTLVMDLRAGAAAQHNPVSSAIGLSVAVMLGSEGDDDFSEWLNNLI